MTVTILLDSDLILAARVAQQWKRKLPHISTRNTRNQENPKQAKIPKIPDIPNTLNIPKGPKIPKRQKIKNTADAQDPFNF